MSRRDHDATRHDESGLTLVELIVSLMLVMMISGALSAAIMTAMRMTRPTTQRAQHSSEAQVIAGFFTRDAQASGGTDPLTGAYNPDLGLGATAGSATGCAAPGTPLVRFQWIERATLPATRQVVVYSYQGSTAPLTLVRTSCIASDPADSLTLAERVDEPPEITCDGGACTTAFPNAVSMAVTEMPDDPAVSPNGSRYVFTGSVRTNDQNVTNAQAHDPSTRNARPLVVLGPCPGIAMDESAIARIYGQMQVNVANQGACRAMTTDDDAGIYPGSTTVLTGASCSADDGGHCPPIPSAEPPVASQYTPAIANPFATLVPPDPSGMPVRGGSCTGGFLQPGRYPSGLVVSGNCTLATGKYWFDGDVRVTSGQLNGTAGVLLYLAAGRLNVTGGTTSLTAQSSGAYARLAVWQVSGLDLAVTGRVTIGGSIYAPNGRVALNGSSAFLWASAAVVRGLNANNDAEAYFGAGADPLRINNCDPLPSLRAWTVGQPSYPGPTLTGTGGYGDRTWSASGVDGLTISTGGTIGGIPNQTGNRTLTVRLDDLVHDNGGFFDQCATRTLPVRINFRPNIASDQLLAFRGRLYSHDVGLTGGTAPFTWTASGLPPGLSFDPVTGRVFGTPTTVDTWTVTFGVTDAAGATDTQTVTFRVVPPVVIASVELQNRNDSGEVKERDRIIVRFSDTMRASSFCSRWDDGDDEDYEIDGRGDVTVSLNNGFPNNDTISISSSECGFGGFNFGSINLGSGSYVRGGSVQFGSNSFFGDYSEIDWDESSQTLTITLGDESGSGDTNFVSSSVPVYTSDPDIRDADGFPLETPTFTLPNRRHF